MPPVPGGGITPPGAPPVPVGFTPGEPAMPPPPGVIVFGCMPKLPVAPLAPPVPTCGMPMPLPPVPPIGLATVECEPPCETPPVSAAHAASAALTDATQNNPFAPRCAILILHHTVCCRRLPTQQERASFTLLDLYNASHGLAVTRRAGLDNTSRRA